MPHDASDPLVWLARAKSNLARAQLGRTSPEVVWEDPCFDAHQAAEKALKALLVALGRWPGLIPLPWPGVTQETYPKPRRKTGRKP
nr:HEPN domain-containing protein [Thermus albus]